MDRIIPADKLPADVEMSTYIKERTEFYFVFMLGGITYYAAITKKTRLALGIKKNGHVTSWKKLDAYFDAFQDVAESIYLQIRDVVGQEIKCTLSTQIGEGFQKLFNKSIGNEVAKLLDQKLLKSPEDQE